VFEGFPGGGAGGTIRRIVKRPLDDLSEGELFVPPISMFWVPNEYAIKPAIQRALGNCRTGELFLIRTKQREQLLRLIELSLDGLLLKN
jgi:hypothetical protein